MDIAGLETFFSQYKYHTKLINIKSSMGYVDRFSKYPVLHQVFLDKDIGTIKEMIYLLFEEHKTNRILSEIIESSNLLINLIETIQDGISVKVNISKLPYPEIGVGYHALNFYNFYKEVYKNNISDNDNYDKLQIDIKLAEQVKKYIESIYKPKQVTIECIKEYLLSQFIFGELDLLRIMINCTDVELYNFSEFINKMGSYQRIPTSQILNNYVVEFTYNLIYILGKVLPKQELPLFSSVSNIISQYKLYRDFDLFNKIRELDFALGLGNYKPLKGEILTNSCVYVIEPCNLAYLISELFSNERELTKINTIKKQNLVINDKLSIVTSHNYSSNEFTIYRTTLDGHTHKVLDFSLNGTYPSFIQTENLSDVKPLNVLNIDVNKNIQAVDIIYLYMFGKVYSKSLLIKALKADLVLEYNRIYIEFIEIMKKVFDGEPIHNSIMTDIINRIAKFYDLSDDLDSIVILNNKIQSELSNIGTLTIDNIRIEFDIDYTYRVHSKLYASIIDTNTHIKELYPSFSYDFKEYLNRENSNINLVKLFINVSEYHKQLVILSLLFTHLVPLTRKCLIEKINSTFNNQDL